MHGNYSKRKLRRFDARYYQQSTRIRTAPRYINIRHLCHNTYSDCYKYALSRLEYLHLLAP